MSYAIEKADLKTHGQYLRELWQRNFEGVPSERYEWMYENNPAGQPVVFLLKHDQSNVFVGAMALFPHPLLIKGQQVTGYICGDMAVDHAHRALGPALALIKAAVNHCDGNKPCILLSLPNHKSLPVAFRAGFQALDTYFSLTKIMKSRIYLNRYVKSTIIVNSLTNVADRIMDMFYNFQAYKHGRGVEMELVNEFDSEFDNFTTGASQHISFVGQRTSAFVNWRLVNSPYGRNKIVALKRNNEICGYVSFCVRKRRCDIEDFSFDGSMKTLKVLLAVFTSYQLQHDIDAISIRMAGHESLVNEFKKAGFSIRGKESRFLLYASPEKLKDQILTPSGIWYLTPADNDI